MINRAVKIIAPIMIILYLSDKDLKGIAIELPFLLLNLVVIYLQHPIFKMH